MSAGTKYQLSRIVVAATVPVMCYALSRMIPAGLSGDTHHVKIWFGVCFGALVIGAAAFVVMLHSKARIENPSHQEMEILSAAAADLAAEKRAAEAAKTEYNHKQDGSQPRY